MPDLGVTAELVPESGGFVVRCVELPVCSQGDTMAEALANIREAVEVWREATEG